MNDKLAKFMAGHRSVEVWPSRFPHRHAGECTGTPGHFEGCRKLARRLGVRARAVSRLMSTPAVLGDVAGALLHGEIGKARHMTLTILQAPQIYTEQVISRKYRFIWTANARVASRSILAALLDVDPDAEIVRGVSIIDMFARYPETKSYYRFAFVRHPFDRAISYHTRLHCSHEGYESKILSWVERSNRIRFARFYGLSGTRNFDDYCEWVNTPYGSDKYADYHFISQHLIIRVNHVRPPDFVGRFENLRADLDHVAANVGLPAPTLPVLNTIAGWQATPEALQESRSRMSAQLTERNKALLRKRYAEDFWLGGYS